MNTLISSQKKTLLALGQCLPYKPQRFLSTMSRSTMNTMDYANDFLSFVNSSPSPFHAVDTSRKRLLEAGYKEIKESDVWNLENGHKYFFTRNGSSIVAFIVGKNYESGKGGFSIIGAHTDSPCPKLKPNSKKGKVGYDQVGVQLYGGGLWHTWFDRDLGVAGRIVIKNNKGFLEERLVNLSDPILRIPSLAIHLDRSTNDSFKFNNEVHMTPILGLSITDAINNTNSNTDSNDNDNDISIKSRIAPGLLETIADEIKVSQDSIVDFELSLYDVQKSVIGGLRKEFIYSARLDNLMMSYCSLKALLNSSEQSINQDSNIRLIVLFDNEEIGSTSAYGAASNLLESTLKRLSEIKDKESNWIFINNNLTNHNNSLSIDTQNNNNNNNNTENYDYNYDIVEINNNNNNNNKSYSFNYERVIAKSLLVSADMAHAVHPNYIEKHEDEHRPKMNHGVVIKHNANQRYATTSVTSALLRNIAEKVAYNSHVPVPLQDFVVRNDSPCGSTIGPMLSAQNGIRTIDVGNPQLAMHSIRECGGVKDIEHAINLFGGVFDYLAIIQENSNIS